MAADLIPIRWRDGVSGASDRTLADEVPVAIVVNGTTLAVLLATPADLGDFAVGFALSEGLIATAADAGPVEVVAHADGIEVRLSIADAGADSGVLASRRRTITGPSGCGLCGIESLAAAVVRPRRVTATGPHPTPREIVAAVAALGQAQPLGTATRAVHGAALWRRGAPLIVREDVGRHNALDKLIGAVAGVDTAAAMLLLTSRVSVEMVQKAAVLGAPVIVAVSAPTRLAVATAAAAGLTLVAVARGDGFEVFTARERIASL